jgi:hypothetical protein
MVSFKMVEDMLWLLAWSMHRRGRGKIPLEERVKILGTALMMLIRILKTNPYICENTDDTPLARLR